MVLERASEPFSTLRELPHPTARGKERTQDRLGKTSEAMVEIPMTRRSTFTGAIVISVAMRAKTGDGEAHSGPPEHRSRAPVRDAW